MFGGLRAICVLLLIVGTTSAATACDSCGDVNCGGGLLVWWNPGDLPTDATFELCGDAGCSPASTYSQDGVIVAVPDADEAPGGGELTFRVITDGATQEYSGSGKPHGDCCKAIYLRPVGGGVLRDETFGNV